VKAGVSLGEPNFFHTKIQGLLVNACTLHSFSTSSRSIPNKANHFEATPFGYSADPHTKQSVVCEEEAEAVVRMFKWADAGVTPSVIASCANALRWITGGGNPWTARQVLSILTNHTYAGLVVHGFAFRDGCHAALVDRELYHRVQNLIVGRRTGRPGRRARGLQERDDLRP
jgi:hypothetical protein